MTIIAIVLASGRGERLGGPKALLAWPPDSGARPMAVAHIEARAECERVVVVVREAVADVLRRHLVSAFASCGELVVSRAADQLGPAGSLAAAAEHLFAGEPHASDQLALVTPVDCPPASAAVVAALLAPLRTGSPALAARPRFGDRRGHPVAMRASLLAEHYRSAQPRPLRDVLRELDTRVVDVDIDDPTVLLDIDTPQDLLRWRQSQAAGTSRLEEQSVVPAFFE